MKVESIIFRYEMENLNGYNPSPDDLNKVCISRIL